MRTRLARSGSQSSSAAADNVVSHSLPSGVEDAPVDGAASVASLPGPQHVARMQPYDYLPNHDYNTTPEEVVSVTSVAPLAREPTALHVQVVNHGARTSTGSPLASPTELHSFNLAGDYGWSPETATPETLTSDLASTRWLSLLANDAAQVDSGFSLAGSPESQTQTDARIPEGINASGRNGQGLEFDRASAQLQQSAITNPSARTSANCRVWQLERDITLTDHETVLFRHFIQHISGWMDLLDPSVPFFTRAVRLALRNVGAMKAILALSAKSREAQAQADRAKGSQLTPAQASVYGEGEQPTEDEATDESIQYYYETLHYVQKLLGDSTYTQSEELLVTAIAISAYEMLDNANGRGNWQRHLKGVFWIQRSQLTDGECGGLRQAVWWSWLLQDIWAAFRDKRKCLTLWRPKLKLTELSQYQLARRTLYTLAHAVNYCAISSAVEATGTGARDGSAVEQLAQARQELLERMEAIRSLWGDEFTPMSTPPRHRGDGREEEGAKQDHQVFKPLWIHPPHFGVAVQAFSFAQILVTLHSPVAPGFDGYLRMQKTMSDAVDKICGVAMDMTDPSCQIMSAQCLYGAGLCVQDKSKREKILSLMKECRERVGWAPIAMWREDLESQWAKGNAER